MAEAQNTSPQLHVIFLWHMHQPVYQSPVDGEFLLPWVRFHCTKDYCDMPLYLQDYPDIKLVFNLSPCLIDQIESYAREDARERVLTLSRKNAADLGEHDVFALVSNFFDAPYERMIDPHHGYRELFQLGQGELADAARRFGTQQLRDLQVWFNLTWCGRALRADPFIADLFHKGSGFTEDEKHSLLDRQLGFMQRVVPLYQQLLRQGRIELLTCPYYHPILPLVWNMDVASQGGGRLELPVERYYCPTDVIDQIKLAMARHRELFDIEPEGLWPPEGAISREVVKSAASLGLKWVVTDQALLHKTLEQPSLPPAALRQPYRFCNSILFFRDVELSDRIGFVYPRWNTETAVDDFIGRLRSMADQAASAGIQLPMVVVALDGENAWEYYPDNGAPFLNSLYAALQNDPGLRLTTFSDYLALKPETAYLADLMPGSWVDGDFKTWVGSTEKNRAWTYLKRARTVVDRCVRELPPESGRSQAELELIPRVLRAAYIAEGSDWFWWLGPGHSSKNDPIFDDLFRSWLRSIYQSLDLTVPAVLDQPIAAQGGESSYDPPLHLISPEITGDLDGYYKWLGAGKCDREAGAIHPAHPIVERIFFAFDRDNFYLRVDGYDRIENYIDQGYQCYLVILEPSRIEFLLLPPQADGKLTLGVGIVLEVAVPRAMLQAELPGDQRRPQLSFFLRWERDGKEVERFPITHAIELAIPVETFGEDNWVVL